MGLGQAQPAGDPADTATWTVNPADYPDNMILTAVLVLRGEESNHPDHLVAAFIDDVCRGVGRPVYLPALDRYLLTLFIYGGEADGGATVTFRVYDAAYQEVREVRESLPYQSDEVIGSLSVPFRLHAAAFFATIHHRDLRCATDQSAYAVAVAEGGSPPYTYRWSNGSQAAQIIHLTAGWYYLTVTDREGERTTDSVEVRNLNQQIAAPQLSLFPGDTICGGEDVFLINLADEADLTRWYDEEGALLGTGAWLQLTGIMNDCRIMARHDLSGCVSAPTESRITARGPGADFQVTPGTQVAQGGLVQFHPAASGAGYQYRWTFGDGGWSTYEDPFYFYNLTGIFDVALEVTDTEGCRSRLEKPAFIQVVAPGNGLQPGPGSWIRTEGLTATIFPNPFDREVMLIWKVNLAGPYTIRVFDLAGSLLYDQEWFLEAGPAQRELNLEHVAPAPGIYLLEISGPGTQSTFKLLKKS